MKKKTTKKPTKKTISKKRKSITVAQMTQIVAQCVADETYNHKQMLLMICDRMDQLNWKIEHLLKQDHQEIRYKLGDGTHTFPP